VGLRDIDPDTGVVVALELWQASEHLPEGFLTSLDQRAVESSR